MFLGSAVGRTVDHMSRTPASPALTDDVADLAAWGGSHDEAAFARLVERHAPMVSAVCRRDLGPGDAADEATQAVFIVLARRGDGISDPTRLRAWLFGTAIRVCRSARRTAARRIRHEQVSAMHVGVQDADESPETAWSAARPHLNTAIAALSARQRDILVDHYLGGMSQAAIATRLGISEDAAHQRIHYALGKLRAWFGKRGLVMGAGVLASGLASETGAAEPALISACTRAALHPTVVPGASALAAGVQMVGVMKMAALVGVAVLLSAIGAIVLWRGQASAQAQLAIVSQAEPLQPPRLIETPRILCGEDFEDEAYRVRGWYDNPGFITSSTEHAPGGARAAEFRFRPGAETPVSGGPSRHLFPAVEAIRISYRIKYGPGWLDDWGLSQLMVMTTEDDAWESPSYTHLTCAIGFERGVPFVSLMDPRNVAADRIGQDLVALTEARAVAGGNGDSDGHGPGGCYARPDDGRIGNGKRFLVSTAAMTDHPGAHSRGQWHHIEVRLRLNRIADGKGVPDGRLAYLLDGRPVLNLTQVMFRTGQHPAMRFNQVVIGPWSFGAPQEQVFWIDDLCITEDHGLPACSGRDAL